MQVGILIVLIASAACGALGQSTKPATQPTHADPPAATPKQALRSLNLAMRDGDSAAIFALFETSDERGAKLVSAMGDYSAAIVALHKASEGAYGVEGANTVTGDIKAQSVEGLSAIDRSVETINGDAALIRFNGATDAPVRLVKVDGKWKVPFSQILDGADVASEERQLKELTHQIHLAQKTAEEVAAGKYKEGALKAAEVWRSRLLEPVTPHTRPTTGESR